MAWTMWYVIVEGNCLAVPMEYLDALEVEQRYRLQGLSAYMIKCSDYNK